MNADGSVTEDVHNSTPAKAVVDRITHRAHIIETKSEQLAALVTGSPSRRAPARRAGL